MPPLKSPKLVSEPNQGSLTAPEVAIPNNPETSRDEEADRAYIPRFGSPHLGFHDLEGLGRRIVRWLHRRGATYPRFIRLRRLQNRLSLHRYTYWRHAVGYLKKLKVVEVKGREITLIDPAWGIDREKAKPKKRRPRTKWFEEHLPEFLKRDGLA